MKLFYFAFVQPSDSVAMEMWDVSDEDNTHAVKEEKGRNEDRCNLVTKWYHILLIKYLR